MNEYFAGDAGTRRDASGPYGAALERDGAELKAGPLTEARARVNAGFDRLAKSIATGSDANAGLGGDEIALLLGVLEEKRAEELSGAMPVHRARAWLANSEARTVLMRDPRAALIFRGLNSRRLSSAERPLRYFGFVDDAGFRVFEFGRLPDTAASQKYHVSVSLAFFLHSKMVLQDGPGFCAALLAEREEPADCVASDEDLDHFLASRAPKTADKRRATSRTETRYDGK